MFMPEVAKMERFLRGFIQQGTNRINELHNVNIILLSRNDSGENKPIRTTLGK